MADGEVVGSQDHEDQDQAEKVGVVGLGRVVDL